MLKYIGIWLWMLATSYSVNRWKNAGNWRLATVLLSFSLVRAAKVTNPPLTLSQRKKTLCQPQKAPKFLSFIIFSTKISKMVISLNWSPRYTGSFHLRTKDNQTHWWDLTISGFKYRTQHSDMIGTGNRKRNYSNLEKGDWKNASQWIKYMTLAA